MSKEYLDAFRKIMETYGNTNSLEGTYNDFLTIKIALQRLEAIDNAKPSEALEALKRLGEALGDLEINGITMLPKVVLSGNRAVNYKIVEQSLIKAQEQEKENELLREIIKSFFVKGCPLHLYIDREFGLTIEVDSECSIMQLGEFKGVDLMKKLKEVLVNEENSNRNV